MVVENSNVVEIFHGYKRLFWYEGPINTTHEQVPVTDISLKISYHRLNGNIASYLKTEDQTYSRPTMTGVNVRNCQRDDIGDILSLLIQRELGDKSFLPDTNKTLQANSELVNLIELRLKRGVQLPK